MFWSTFRCSIFSSTEFLGANVFDSKPFIVIQYLKNGNARDYVHNHQGCNRLVIVCHRRPPSWTHYLLYRLALSSQYRPRFLTPQRRHPWRPESCNFLFRPSQNVSILMGSSHQSNVLIDDLGNAVLCDFGLSRMKSDATQAATSSKHSPFGELEGSRNWMSPERLLGGRLTLSRKVDKHHSSLPSQVL